MAVQTNQLLRIAKATVSKIYNRDSEAETHGRVKALVLLLKQHHAYYYRFYEKGTIRAMVGLSRLHSGNTFRHSNVSAGVRLKLFCPWCFKFCGNTETISIHLREVHYWLAIVCNIRSLFASISVQVILEHRVSCKVIRSTEHRVKKSLKKKSKAREQEKAS